MIEICFTLQVTNREALRVPNEEGNAEPWDLDCVLPCLPRRHEWVTVNHVRLRVGTPVFFVGDPGVEIGLVAEQLEQRDATLLGVKYEPWMSGRSPLVSDAKRWADLSDEDRDAFEAWAKRDRDV